MNRPDLLAAVELMAVIEEATLPLRHDVSNRLASVGNMAYFVRRKLAEEPAVERDPRVSGFLDQIAVEVRRADSTIEEWMSRIRGLRASEPRAVAVADCLRVAVEASRLPNSVTVEVVSRSNGLQVAADLDSVAVALRCLIENAAEAERAARVMLSAQASGDQCLISVVDDGAGIAEPTRCLERFYSTKPGHLGLGLSLAQRIAERFGGRLTLETPAAGAELRVYLPLARPARIPGEDS